MEYLPNAVTWLTIVVLAFTVGRRSRTVLITVERGALLCLLAFAGLISSYSEITGAAMMSLVLGYTLLNELQKSTSAGLESRAPDPCRRVSGSFLLLLSGIAGIILLELLAPVAPIPAAGLLLPAAFRYSVPHCRSSTPYPAHDLGWLESLPVPAAVVKAGGAIVADNTLSRQSLTAGAYIRVEEGCDNGEVPLRCVGVGSQRRVCLCRPILRHGKRPTGLFLCYMEQSEDSRIDQGVDSELLRAYRLTPREKDVLNLLLRGLSYRQIGSELCVSEATVRSHVHSIYRKTGAGDRGTLLVKVHGEKE